MKILIIEDEEPAAERLIKLFAEIEPGAEILDVVVSVQSAIKWFRRNPMPDLITFDIHLADGQSFEIFEQVEVTAPVIFITAFDEYAIKAFKVNSIDYLLKPFKKEEFEDAIKKFHKLHAVNSTSQINFSQLLESLKNPKPEFKKRFIIRYGDHIKIIDTQTIAYFFTADKINFLRTDDNKTFPLDFNLDKLETMLDPAVFFRINRQFIISIHSIEEMFAFSKSRVKIKLKPPIEEDTIVSTERSSFFKDWLGGEK